MTKRSIVDTTLPTNSDSGIDNHLDSEHILKTALQYPHTRSDSIVNNYFGIQIPDPYRWLEDDRSTETAQWIESQNRVTHDFLSQIPYRNALQKRLKTLLDYEKISAPFIEGEHTYFYKNDGLQNQYVLYRKTENDQSEVFLDPNTFSEDGTTSLSDICFSKDGKLAAYQISEGGSDWQKIFIIDTESGEILEDPLVDVKFSDLSWLGNQGFYYSSYDKPEGSELSAKTDQHKLYFHTLTTPQKADELIFGGSASEKHRYVSGEVTEDDRYLLIYAMESTSGNKLFLKDLQQASNPLITVLDNTDSDTHFLDNSADTLYLVTNLDAPNQKVVRVSARNPLPEHWRDVIPETPNVIEALTGSGYIFAHYMIDAISQVKQYDLQGQLIREITLPDAGTAKGFDGKKEQSRLHFQFSNYKTPDTIFELDPETGVSTVYQESGARFDPEWFVSSQVFYHSKDGTRIPMIITHRKDLVKDGKNPTILYGYGGFNVSLTPYFSATIAQWLELGGIYAVANLRGGGEYGKEWHIAGTRLQKQNVFDDFIAAAEYLIAENYSSSEYLAISGGSNGGLLVGATMTQRPDLFKVALPAVGVLDMLRYHTFTSGAGWAYDYGTSGDNAEMFEYLESYSPVHNVRDDIEYPATLVTTGDHDDRVVPAHSFKFAAELQSKQKGFNPTLIRIETDAGHGAGTPTSKIIEQYSDIYAFTLYNMGVKQLS